MNADMKRLARDNSGSLFDMAGPTSLGSLPHGDIRPRQDAIIITSADRANYFPIGSETRTAPIPDDILVRGNEEIRKRNIAATQRIKTLGEIANGDTPKYLESVVPRAEKKHIVLDDEVSSQQEHLTESNSFLSQSLENPTRRGL